LTNKLLLNDRKLTIVRLLQILLYLIVSLQTVIQYINLLQLSVLLQSISTTERSKDILYISKSYCPLELPVY
jgi:hypothetical protein